MNDVIVNTAMAAFSSRLLTCPCAVDGELICRSEFYVIHGFLDSQ